MPAEGVPLSPSSKLMQPDELFTIAKYFVEHGVDKIRLTGGEPLVRKDFPVILEKLATLPVSITMTTNGILVDRFLEPLKKAGITSLNISLDTLHPEVFQKMTLKSNFDKVMENIELLMSEGFSIKINVVLIKGVNDQEIIPFIEWTKELKLNIRFIEFMPFDGNQWDRSKTVGMSEIMDELALNYPYDKIIQLPTHAHDTAKNFKIKGYEGSFGIISTVTNPFCDSCNRIRLTATGTLRNCLFSEEENDLLGALRKGESIQPLIAATMATKHATRAGLDTPEKFADTEHHQKNRSMITIGG